MENMMIAGGKTPDASPVDSCEISARRYSEDQTHTEKLLYPPGCSPFDFLYPDYAIVEGLQSILNYFTDFSHNNDDIYKYYELWTQVNEIARLNNSQTIRLFAICASVEICRNFANVPSQMRRYNSPTNFRTLYILITGILENMTADNFILKDNLLRQFTKDRLFRVDHFCPSMSEGTADKMFLSMFKSLAKLCSEFDVTKNIHQLATKGVTQLISSAGNYASSSVVLKEFLSLLLTGNYSARFMVKQCIGKLNIYHFQMLCRITAHRVAQRIKSDLFNGGELILMEKIIMIVPCVKVFYPIIYMIQKESLNYSHPDHKEILRLLCALIVRYTGAAKENCQSFELEQKRDIQMMISKFLKVMMRPTLRPHASLLQKYGSELIRNSPDTRTKFQYFKMFQHYTKITTGEVREKLSAIFENSLREWETESRS